LFVAPTRGLGLKHAGGRCSERAGGVAPRGGVDFNAPSEVVKCQVEKFIAAARRILQPALWGFLHRLRHGPMIEREYALEFAGKNENEILEPRREGFDSKGGLHLSQSQDIFAGAFGNLFWPASAV
jgi:hypothetical protein